MLSRLFKPLVARYVTALAEELREEDHPWMGSVPHTELPPIVTSRVRSAASSMLRAHLRKPGHVLSVYESCREELIAAIRTHMNEHEVADLKHFLLHTALPQFMNHRTEEPQTYRAVKVRAFAARRQEEGGAPLLDAYAWCITDLAGTL